MIPVVAGTLAQVADPRLTNLVARRIVDLFQEDRELATLPPDERKAFVRSVARRGDPLPVRAVEGSPVRPLIPDVDLQRAKQELLEARELGC
jgi:hypothetical protein